MNFKNCVNIHADNNMKVTNADIKNEYFKSMLYQIIDNKNIISHYGVARREFFENPSSIFIRGLGKIFHQQAR